MTSVGLSDLFQSSFLLVGPCVSAFAYNDVPGKPVKQLRDEAIYVLHNADVFSEEALERPETAALDVFWKYFDILSSLLCT